MPTKKNNKAKKKKQGTQPNGTSSSTNNLNAVDADDNDSIPDLEPMAVDEPVPEPEPDAEQVKERGNVAFKAGRYADAIDFYSKAIQMRPTEPAYYTNRAASYMALKRFRPALTDCQQASTLQSSSPSAKTLLRLARCQLAVGSPTPALSTLRTVLALSPGLAPALELQKKTLALEGHLKSLEAAQARKEWGMARLALDKCFQALEGEGSDIPTQWRCWRVELELTRANWDAASIAANDAIKLEPNSPDMLALRGLVLFLTAKLAQASQQVQSALRLDPEHGPARRLRTRIKGVEKLKDEGNVAFKAGRLQEAVVKYGEALDVIGENEEEGKGGQIRATLLSNRATALLKLDQHEAALVDTDASLLLYPASFKALRTRGRIYLHLERYDAAIADFKSAINQADIEGSEADERALRSELQQAEVALKRSKTKDYYKILGLEKDCTDADIKKAYRRESLKHHPDKGGDEEKFKLVVEANAVLSDSQRRRRYDMGEDVDGSMASSGQGGFQSMSPEDMAHIFHAFGGSFGGFGGGGGRGHTHGFSF